jgi:hypothetical protein
VREVKEHYLFSYLFIQVPLYIARYYETIFSSARSYSLPVCEMLHPNQHVRAFAGHVSGGSHAPLVSALASLPRPTFGLLSTFHGASYLHAQSDE